MKSLNNTGYNIGLAISKAMDIAIIAVLASLIAFSILF
jgi:hypothetical protein